VDQKGPEVASHSVAMGSGVSSLPAEIDKEKFRALCGSTMNDALFDANSVAGSHICSGSHVDNGEAHHSSLSSEIFGFTCGIFIMCPSDLRAL